MPAVADALGAAPEQTLQVTQIRSLIGSKVDQRATVRSLGLRRIRHTVSQPDRPEIRGMVAKVAHLVEVRYASVDEVVHLEAGQQPKGAGHHAAGASVDDDAVEALREEQAEALAEPGQAAGGSVVVNPPGLTSTDAPDAPSAAPADVDLDTDGADDAAPAPDDSADAALADPRGDLARFQADQEADQEQDPQ